MEQSKEGLNGLGWVRGNQFQSQGNRTRCQKVIGTGWGRQKRKEQIAGTRRKFVSSRASTRLWEGDEGVAQEFESA